MTLLSLIRGFKGTLTNLTIASALVYNSYIGLEHYINNFDQRASRVGWISRSLINVPMDPEKLTDYKEKLTKYEELINNPEVMEIYRQNQKDLHRFIGFSSLSLIALLISRGFFVYEKQKYAGRIK